MNIKKLIGELECFADEFGEETEVRTMTQQNWPFENAIRGLCSRKDLESNNPDLNELLRHAHDPSWPEDDRQAALEEYDRLCATGEKDPVVYLVEGSQLCYGNKDAWDLC